MTINSDITDSYRLLPHQNMLKLTIANHSPKDHKMLIKHGSPSIYNPLEQFLLQLVVKKTIVMATTAEKKSRSKQKNIPQAIRDAYIKYRLENGHEPPSIYSFATNELNMSEGEFYEYFNSFTGIEQDVWHSYYHQTVVKMEGDETYENYSSHEKLLAFFFTLFEVMKQNRSFIMLSFEKRDKKNLTPGFLNSFYEAYTEFMKELIADGAETGEVAMRPERLQSTYHRLVWAQFMFLVDFWVKDTSRNFEDTDAAIEKSVNLLFDVIGKNIVDNAFDFAKFIIGRR